MNLDQHLSKGVQGVLLPLLPQPSKFKVLKKNKSRNLKWEMPNKDMNNQFVIQICHILVLHMIGFD